VGRTTKKIGRETRKEGELMEERNIIEINKYMYFDKDYGVF
jgi:hypothetical protein